MKPSSIRILLLDDHAALHEPMELHIAPEVELRILAGFAATEDSLRQIDGYDPHAVLIDLNHRGAAAFDVVRNLRQRWPKVKVVLLSTHFSNYAVDQALRLDVDGCLTKTDPLPRMLEAVKRIANNEHVYSPDVEQRIDFSGDRPHLKANIVSPLADLTPRQIEVLQHLAEGKSKRQIAEKMHISAKTVGSHVEKLMNKLDIHDRVALARFAIREGIVQA